MEAVKQLERWLQESRYAVFFGGAGVSTESGIPDFRSVDGLYHQKYDYPPEEILSHHFFLRHPEAFYDFYWDRVVHPEALPNRAHIQLAKWESLGKLQAVVTQNIDGLHQAAGSKEVLELHGSVARNYCMACGKKYALAELSLQGVPRCTCGGMIRPDVVLYEEGLDQRVLQRAIAHIARADLLIVGGTSLVVYPAAGLVDYYQGRRLVQVNLAETAGICPANLLIRGKIAEVFSQINLI